MSETVPTIGYANNDLPRFVKALESVGVSAEVLASTLAEAQRRSTEVAIESADTAAHEVWAQAYRRSFPALSAMVAGTRMPFGSYPALDYLASSCIDVAEGFERLARYFGLVRPDCRIVIDADASEPTVTFVDERRTNDWFFDEWTLGVTVRGFRGAMGTFSPHLVLLRRDGADPAAREIAEEAIGCAIRLGSAHASLVFTRSQWETKLPGGDPRLRDTLERHADDLLDEKRAVRGTSRRVRDVLARDLSGGEPTVQAIAKKLALSPRTLQRQLSGEGTTYQEVLDGLRAELAKKHLARGIGVTEVAFLLGYADGSAFARAFRRWYGKAPAAARREA